MKSHSWRSKQSRFLWKENTYVKSVQSRVGQTYFVKALNNSSSSNFFLTKSPPLRFQNPQTHSSTSSSALFFGFSTLSSPPRGIAGGPRRANLLTHVFIDKHGSVATPLGGSQRARARIGRSGGRGRRYSGGFWGRPRRFTQHLLALTHEQQSLPGRPRSSSRWSPFRWASFELLHAGFFEIVRKIALESYELW